MSLSPLSSAVASSLPSVGSSPSDRSVELVRLLERSIRESHTVDVEGLCVMSGESVWALRVELLVVDDAGNLGDAVSTAALAALLRYRRPDVTVVGGKVVLHSMDDRQPIPLHLHHLPVCCTFAVFDGGQLWVVDPTLEEEQASEAMVSCVIDDFHQLAGLYKMGGVGGRHLDERFPRIGACRPDVGVLGD